MEITGSSSGGSSSSSPPNSSTESLNGLKFDKKIYFEDVGPTAPRKSGSGSSSTSSASATSPKKVRSCPVQAAQPPRCQVEGCKVDLSDAKAYYSRHKVCDMHSSTSSSSSRPQWLNLSFADGQLPVVTGNRRGREKKVVGAQCSITVRQKENARVGRRRGCDGGLRRWWAATMVMGLATAGLRRR